MLWIKSRTSRLTKGIGALLVLSGFFFGYWWFYKLAPVCHTLDRKWQFAHSQQEYWAEVEMAIHRGFWIHDDGFTVGWFGDKSWAEWIMARVRPGDKMGCMGAKLCHSSTAMEYITNQNIGDEAGPWLTWWENNKSKSQEEWIADGFRQNGLEVAVPPAPEQIPVLLAILGTP